MSSSPQSVKTLAAVTKVPSNGHLSDALEELVEAGFLSVDEGLNPYSTKEVREVRYRIHSPTCKHRHGPGANKCIWCGSTSNGSGCIHSPTGRHEK